MIKRKTQFKLIRSFTIFTQYLYGGVCKQLFVVCRQLSLSLSFTVPLLPCNFLLTVDCYNSGKIESGLQELCVLCTHIIYTSGLRSVRRDVSLASSSAKVWWHQSGELAPLMYSAPSADITVVYGHTHPGKSVGNSVAESKSRVDGFEKVLLDVLHFFAKNGEKMPQLKTDLHIFCICNSFCLL